MASQPNVYTIKAPDAPQHTGKLQEILQNLKTENRIGGFTVLGADDDLSSVTDNIGGEDLILIVLTRQLEPHKEQIESRSKVLKSKYPEVKVAEILVDKVVYDNEFITFPTDLRPIRDREDMDTVWNDIENRLMDLFPIKESKEKGSTASVNWSKYMKLAGSLIGLLLIFYMIIELDFSDGNQTDDRPPNNEVEDSCDPLPDYLSELRCIPDGFPGATVPLILEFAASGPDPGGRIEEYRWEYNGEVKTGRRVEYTLENRGTNLINLRVSDISGCTVHRQCRIVAR